VRDSDDVVWVPVLQFIGELCTALWLSIPLFRPGIPKLTLGPGLAIFRAAGFVTASRLLRIAIVTAGIIFLGFMAGERAVGLFSACYRICFLLMAINMAINVAYLPSFARAQVHGAETLVSLTHTALRFSGLIAAPLIVGGIVTARPVLEFLFGAPYGDAAPAFQLLLLGVGWTFVHGVLHNLFLVLHRTHTEMLLFGLAAAVTVALNVVLIPRYGTDGAAFAAAAAEAAIAIPGWLAIRRFGVHIGFRPIVAPLTAAAGMAAILLALPPLPLPIVIATGAVVYGAGLAVIGGIRRDLLSRVVSLMDPRSDADS
jgi:O-antigen/teichoic acid export membrane protein